MSVCYSVGERGLRRFYRPPIAFVNAASKSEPVAPTALGVATLPWVDWRLDSMVLVTITIYRACSMK